VAYGARKLGLVDPRFGGGPARADLDVRSPIDGDDDAP
jgi:hypothetical protein